MKIMQFDERLFLILNGGSMEKSKILETEINLIPKEEIKEEPVNVFFSRALKTAKITLIAMDLFLAAVFVFSFKLNADLVKVNQEVDAKNSQIQKNLTFEKDFLTTQKRLTVLSASYRTVEKRLPLLSFVEEKIPQDLSLTRLALSTDGNLIISGGALNYTAVAQLIDIIRGDSRFSNMTILSLGRDEKTKEITFSLQAHLGLMPTPTPIPGLGS